MLSLLLTMAGPFADLVVDASSKPQYVVDDSI
jgi:hypothetical protein